MSLAERRHLEYQVVFESDDFKVLNALGVENYEIQSCLGILGTFPAGRTEGPRELVNHHGEWI